MSHISLTDEKTTFKLLALNEDKSKFLKDNNNWVRFALYFECIFNQKEKNKSNFEEQLWNFLYKSMFEKSSQIYRRKLRCIHDFTPLIGSINDLAVSEGEIVFASIYERERVTDYFILSNNTSRPDRLFVNVINCKGKSGFVPNEYFVDLGNSKNFSATDHDFIGYNEKNKAKVLKIMDEEEAKRKAQCKRWYNHWSRLEDVGMKSKWDTYRAMLEFIKRESNGLTLALPNDDICLLKRTKDNYRNYSPGENPQELVL